MLKKQILEILSNRYQNVFFFLQVRHRDNIKVSLCTIGIENYKIEKLFRKFKKYKIDYFHHYNIMYSENYNTDFYFQEITTLISSRKHWHQMSFLHEVSGFVRMTLLT